MLAYLISQLPVCWSLQGPKAVNEKMVDLVFPEWLGYHNPGGGMCVPQSSLETSGLPLGPAISVYHVEFSIKHLYAIFCRSLKSLRIIYYIYLKNQLVVFSDLL